MKVIWVDIYEKLASAPVEKGQELDVPMVDYVSPESKAKPGQSRMNKTHNSRCLLRVLWKLDHLGSFWINRSTNNLLATKAWSRRCTSRSRLLRRVRLGNSLVIPSQQSVVLNSMRTTTFLTFSTLSTTGICRVSPMPTIATLSNPRVHSSPPDCSSMIPKIKWVVNEYLTLGPLLRVLDVNLDNRHVRAGWGLYNVRHRGQYDTSNRGELKKASATWAGVTGRNDLEFQ